MTKVLNPAKLTNAVQAWKSLNGLVLVHKFSGDHYKKLLHNIRLKLCTELNNMEVRPPHPILELTYDTKGKPDLTIKPSYADHILVVGPRYQDTDINIVAANRLELDSSGLMVLGINKGASIATRLRFSALTKVYRVSGLLGQATDNFFITGKIVEKSTYKHIRQHIIDKICASFQSAHQKKMFEFSGVDMQSQAAYELALKGPIRPADNRFPMIYSIKCIEFRPPEFALEITCMNETEMYLKEIIHEMGIRMNTTATCTKVHCMQYGMFNLKSALVQFDWTIENFCKQIRECWPHIRENRHLMKPHVTLQRPTLSET